MRAANGKVYIEDVICTGEGPRSVFVEIEGDQFCIPQSQIDEDSEVWRRGDEGQLVITEWIAGKLGLI